MDFIITNANIVRVTADAIVLPANRNLKEGSGASRAIFEAAGRKELTQACEEIGHCDMGSAVVTLAYNLDAEYIIHAVVPKWIDGEHNEYELLSSAYISALGIADTMMCESIAFPLLSAGNNGFDRRLAFQIAKESIERFKGNNIKVVKLIVYDEEMAVFVKSQGVDVFDHIKISRIKKQEKNREFKDKALNAGIGFIKEHKKEIIEFGVKIAAKVIMGEDIKDIFVGFVKNV